jgi:hypothetical protein
MKPLVLFIATVLLISASARAEHFKIELTVKSAQDEPTAHSDTDPPPEGSNPRPLCHAKRGEDLTLQFFFTSNFPHETLKNVTVHYYIAPEKEAGKKAMAEPGKPNVLEGDFTMDFKPVTGRVGLRQRIHIDQAGTYIVRVESRHSDSDHEHFAAIDLVVE